MNSRGSSNSYFAREHSGARISVVIPAKNAELTIGYTLDSVLRSLTSIRNPWEVIVVNDRSSDATPEIVSRYPSVKMIEGPGKGVGAARNTGAKASSGDIIFFVDADCVVEPNHFQKLLEAFDEKTGIVWTSGLPLEFFLKLPYIRKNKFLGSYLEPYSIMYRGREVEIANIAMCAVRRDAFEGVNGFWECPFAAEDMDFSYRILKAGYRIKKVETKSFSFPRMKVRDIFRQQIWYGRGSVFIYYRYSRDDRFWRIHGWSSIFRLSSLSYVIFVLGSLISPLVAFLSMFLFSPSLSLKKGRFIRLKPLSVLIFDVVNRIFYSWGLLSGMGLLRKHMYCLREP